MAVTLTAATLKNRAPRVMGKLSTPELSAVLSRVTDQVAAWKDESDANSGKMVSMSQFYQNELATLQAQILVLTDRVAAQEDVTVEDTTTFPVGDTLQSRKQFRASGLERALKALTKERDDLLGKLGVSVDVQTLPALVQTTRRAEEYTVGSNDNCNPGIDWTRRSARGPYFDEKKGTTSDTRTDADSNDDD